MTTDRTTCDPMTLSRFLDQEVGPEEHAQISKHLKHCPSCKKALQEHQSIANLFKTGLERQIAQGRLEALEDQVLARMKGSKISWWAKCVDFVKSWWFCVPAAAAATALALFVYLTRPEAPVTGPSAIINSFTGEITSVMIIETPKSRQTILWFQEISMPDAEEDEVQET